MCFRKMPTTLAEETARMGGSWKDNLDRMAREGEMMKTAVGGGTPEGEMTPRERLVALLAETGPIAIGNDTGRFENGGIDCPIRVTTVVRAGFVNCRIMHLDSQSPVPESSIS